MRAEHTDWAGLTLMMLTAGLWATVGVSAGCALLLAAIVALWRDESRLRAERHA
jgi:hypothetical protein